MLIIKTTKEESNAKFERRVNSTYRLIHDRFKVSTIQPYRMIDRYSPFTDYFTVFSLFKGMNFTPSSLGIINVLLQHNNWSRSHSNFIMVLENSLDSNFKYLFKALIIKPFVLLSQAELLKTVKYSPSKTTVLVSNIFEESESYFAVLETDRKIFIGSPQTPFININLDL